MLVKERKANSDKLKQKRWKCHCNYTFVVTPMGCGEYDKIVNLRRDS